MNALQTFLEKEEGDNTSLCALIEHISSPNEEIRLTPVNKVRIVYGLQLVGIELSRATDSAPDNSLN